MLFSISIFVQRSDFTGLHSNTEHHPNKAISQINFDLHFSLEISCMPNTNEFSACLRWESKTVEERMQEAGGNIDNGVLAFVGENQHIF